MSVNTAKKISSVYRYGDWVSDELTRFRAKKTIALYNAFRVMNQKNEMNKEQWEKLSEAYRPNSNYPETTVKRFINNQIVKDVSDKRLIEYCEDHGINIPFIIKEQKELLVLSKESKQYGVAHKVIESMKNDLGLSNKVKIIEKQQISGNLEGINETIQQVKTERKQVTERNEEKQANDKEQ